MARVELLPLDSTRQLVQGRGRHRVLAALGEGGMARVYLAVAQGPSGFNKLCVLKALRPALSIDPDFLKMFLNEARLAARLNHPNIVQTYEVGEDAGLHVIVMEYLEGQSLAHVFTLLSLVLPRDPLQIAFRSLHSEDKQLRGTALEYLEGVLPAPIRERLWPFLVYQRPERPAPCLRALARLPRPRTPARAPARRGW